MDAIIYREAFIGISKPFFIYNKKTNELKVVPTIVLEGTTTGATFDPLTDELVTKLTEEELMAEFDRLGFTMPEQDTWDFEERPLRLAIPNDDLTEIIKVMPTVIGLLDILKDFIIVRNRTQFIYLEEIYPEDRVKFANYLQERP